MLNENPQSDGIESEGVIDYLRDVAPSFARRYLDTYFCDIDEDERRICTFLIEEYAKIPKGSTMIEIGSGPCIQHSLPAVPYVHSIQLSDYLEDNLHELDKWQAKDSTAFNWNHFTQYILENETQAGTTPSEIMHRENELRRKITKIRHADILQPNVIGSDEKFDVVGFFYCAEAASRTKPQWEQSIANVSTLVNPGGKMFMASCRNTDFYVVKTADGEEQIPTANVNEKDFYQLLPRIGFDLDQSRIEVKEVDMDNHGIGEIILLALQKKG